MKSILTAVEKAAGLARFPLPPGSVLPWPSFSLASYAITARLAAEGITPRTVIDVGANRGQFTMACIKRFRHPGIYAFEPILEAFQSFLSATAGLQRVKAYNIAIGERNGPVEFHISSDLQSSSILTQNGNLAGAFPELAVTHTVEVPMKTLEVALSGVPLEDPVLLKLDVQGYESRVIQGAASVLDDIDYVVAETSFAPLYEGECAFVRLMDVLAVRGFEFRRPVGMLVSPETGAFLQMDALFCRSRRN